MLVHLRLTAPADLTDSVRETLCAKDWITNVTLQRDAVLEPPGDLLECDVAREKAGPLIDKLERCVSWQTREELGVANVEHSRLSSTCDAMETAMTAVQAMLYKLQIRSPELIDEFCTLVEQLGENRRFEQVAADVVLQRVFTDGFASSYEQR